jgi:cytochrome c biogenesis protein ResB
LLSLLVLSLASSYIVPQVPAHIRSDPVGYQEWLSAIRAVFKDWTPFLQTLGIFSIYSTSWFRILLAVLAFHTLVSLGARIGLMLAPSPVRQHDAFYNVHGATVISGPWTSTRAVEELGNTMQILLGHVDRETDAEKQYLYASRGRWTAGSAVALHLGLLFLVGGLAVNGRWGWAQSGVQLLPSETVFVGPEASHKIRLEHTGSGPGTAVLQAGEQQHSFSVRGGRTYQRGFLYRLIDGGSPLVRVSARHNGGGKLTLYEYRTRPKPQESLQFAFPATSPEEDADRLFIVSDAKVVGRLAWSNRGATSDEQPRFHLWVFREGGQALVGESEIVPQDDTTSVALGDITYDLDVSRYVVLDVEYRPGLWALCVGGLLLVVGLLGALVPRQRMWAVVSAEAETATIRIREQTAGLSGRFRRRRTKMLSELRAQIENA